MRFVFGVPPEGGTPNTFSIIPDIAAEICTRSIHCKVRYGGLDSVEVRQRGYLYSGFFPFLSLIPKVA